MDPVALVALVIAFVALFKSPPAPAPRDHDVTHETRLSQLEGHIQELEEKLRELSPKIRKPDFIQGAFDDA